MKTFIQENIKKLGLSEILTISDKYTFDEDGYFVIEISDDPKIFKDGDILDDRILQLLDILDEKYEGYEDSIPFEVISNSEGFTSELWDTYDILKHECSYCGTIATYEQHDINGVLCNKIHFIARGMLNKYINDLCCQYSLLFDEQQYNNDELDKYLINRWVEYGY